MDLSLKGLYQEIKFFCDQEFDPKNLEVIKDFVNFCQQKLQIQDFPKIYFLKDRRIPKITTGIYDDNTNKVYVLVQNRMLVDILRTLAHELTHSSQTEKDKNKEADIEQEKTDINSPYENEAAVNASNFLKEFYRGYKLSEDELFSLYENWG